MIPELRIEDYNYPLPDERIAKYPLSERDSSKLLRYENGKVSEYVFRDIPGLLPDNAIMVFNDTKVVPARLHFVRPTGARIEIFCLQPVKPEEYNLSFAATDSCTWKCVIGNAKKWKGDVLSLYNPQEDEAVTALNMRAELVSREGETGIVRFSWDGGHPFSRVLENLRNNPYSAISEPGKRGFGRGTLSDALCQDKRLCGCSYGGSSFYGESP